MISSLPCSSVTENATCTGSSGEFCFVKWTSFTLRVSCSCDCSGILSLLVPRWDRLKSYGATRADSTGKSEWTAKTVEIVSSRNIFVRVCELRRILQARGARTWANAARRGALAGIGAARQFQPSQQGSNFRPSPTEWCSLLAHQFPLLTHLCHL